MIAQLYDDRADLEVCAPGCGQFLKKRSPYPREANQSIHPRFIWACHGSSAGALLAGDNCFSF